jgi:hypothetical protein
MEIFGGLDFSASLYYKDVWVLWLSGTPGWEELTPAGTPPGPRFGTSAVYDEIGGGMLIFGGAYAGWTNETWNLTAPVPSGVGSNQSVSARLQVSLPSPNPLRDETRFDVTLPEERDTRVDILDVTGRQVAILADGLLEAGRHSFAWNAHDLVGKRVGGGVYFVEAESGTTRAAQRVVVLGK